MNRLLAGPLLAVAVVFSAVFAVGCRRAGRTAHPPAEHPRHPARRPALGHAWLCRTSARQDPAEFPYTPNVRGIRTAEWKYVHYPRGDGSPDTYLPELYDLKSDPGELANLARSTEHAATMERLRTELGALMAATGLTPQADKMPLDEGIKTELPAQNIR